MASAAFIKIVVNGKTNGEIQRLGIKLKPILEVRLGKEDENYLKAIFHEAYAQRSHGNFNGLGKLGLPRAYCIYKIIEIAQDYQKDTPHRDHINGLRTAAGLSWFETAMIILEAAKNLETNVDGRGVKIQKSLEAAGKIADGLLMGDGETPVEKLGGSEFDTVHSMADEVRRMNRREQPNYPFTHRKNAQGEWEIIED